MAHNYVLRVTAGSVYDIDQHQLVSVNDAKPISIESEHMKVDLNVRIQSYRGLPHSAPRTSAYFDLPPHDKNKDQYSICFRFTPKSTINGNDLVFGNDFDHPIRDRLPPGFNTAFRIVKWVVDPGLDGDVYADKPYMYGPAASSVNTLHIGKGEEIHPEAGLIFTEGGDDEGVKSRKEKGIPETEAARKKHFLVEENRKQWDWEEGQSYGCDFFNPYLDFNAFALRLPGFTLPVMKYWDGQPLRYVLKNRATDQTMFVVLFTLYLKEDIDEHGNPKEGVEGGKPFELLDDETREKHERKKNAEDSPIEDEKAEETTTTGTGTGDDDVD